MTGACKLYPKAYKSLALPVLARDPQGQSVSPVRVSLNNGRRGCRAVLGWAVTAGWYPGILLALQVSCILEPIIQRDQSNSYPPRCQAVTPASLPETGAEWIEPY